MSRNFIAERGGLPIVFIKDIIIGVRTIELVLCMKRLSCSTLNLMAAGNDMEIKAILSFNNQLTGKIINRELLPSTNFNLRGDSDVRTDETMQKVMEVIDKAIDRS